MKILDVDWLAFLQVLERYRRLPFGARKFLLENVQPSQPVSNTAMGEWREPLLQCGIMVAGPQGKNASVDRRFQSFVRVMRAMLRNPIFHAPTRDSFHNFVSEHLEGPEISAFSGAGHLYYYSRDYAAVQALHSRVCSSRWVKAFLETKDPRWETPFQAPGSSPYFYSASVLQAAQTMIQKLVPGAVPVPVAQLPGMCPEVRPEVLTAALRGCLRYLLLYPCLLKEGWEPGVGLWPGVAHKLSAEIPRPPEPVDVLNPFHSPFLVDDMTAVLSACSVSPPRLRVDDAAVFEADQKNLLASLGTLPEWIEKHFHWQMENRLRHALDFLRRIKFLAERDRRERELRLQVSDSGAAWLRLGGKDRLKALLDSLRDHSPPSASHDRPPASALLVPHAARLYHGQIEQVASALRAAFRELPFDGFVRLGDFLNYQRERDNPFAALQGGLRHGSIHLGLRTVSDPSADEIEEAWEEQLSAFVQLRLLPLGGARVAGGPENSLCFAITDAGRYLLGAADDFELAPDSSGRIVLQPNCDVVFLAPSAKAEADIGRFCERRGRHLGTLFKVTKQSILAAAASGLKADQVLNTLHEYCGPDLPSNVQHEIVSWFGQFRSVTMAPAILLHCPDAETASRMMSVAGIRVTRITDTILEWHEKKPAPALLKKLREMGIFLWEK